MQDLYDVNPALGDTIDKMVKEGDNARLRGDMESALSLYDKALGRWCRSRKPTG